VIAANAFNMLAGYNGLECGMGMIMLSAVGITCYITGNAWVAFLAGVLVSVLAAFMFFNWYPAKLFPGNAFTYVVGSLIAVLVMLGNVEKLALILFIPYYFDFIFPMRKKMNVEAYAKVNPDGSLSMPYDGVYDLTHLSIKIVGKLKEKVYEEDVVVLILAMEIVIAVVGILLFLLWA
jgi:UDP-N-acetylglucosamine--dolichyl-phosphate N-acetylglucosaminephosphotransferase